MSWLLCVHTLSQEVENDLDPDDGNSMLCSACVLPIFSTPFIKNDSNNLVLHDQCANLPNQLIDHPLHQGGTALILQESLWPTTSTRDSCDRCESVFGSMFYKCPDSECLQLDLKCAVTIKILHRSHQHRLMAYRSAVSFTCGACGTQHHQRGQLSALSYFCNVCDFKIHGECALLPNAINPHEKHHHHPLLLTYALHDDTFGLHRLLDARNIFFGARKYNCCRICKEIIQSFGFYICDSCGYYAHIKCVISDRQSVKPVLIREACIPNLLHFPLEDEKESVMRYITENTSGGSSCSDHATTTHEHPLFYHDHDDGIDGDDKTRVCNICVGTISPPFYSCSQCTDFFLHSCCLHLPGTLTQYRGHQLEHPFYLVPKAASRISTFYCRVCGRQCNGLAYSCKICKDDFNVDVVCALMPLSITHDTHGRAHILYLSFRSPGYSCRCCNVSISFGSYYDCGTCRNFKLHVGCALLPNTIRHKFDRHPLKLNTMSKQTRPTTSIADRMVHSEDQLQLFCEICEKEMETDCWCYSCEMCDQYFHIDCIPSGDYLSKTKLGVTVHVDCHDCPLTSVRAITVDGYRCGHCHSIIRGRSGFYDMPAIAFECSKCYFRLHEGCAEKCLIKGIEANHV